MIDTTNKTERITFRLSEDFRNELQRLAKQLNVKPSTIIRKALRDLLAHYQGEVKK